MKPYLGSLLLAAGIGLLLPERCFADGWGYLYGAVKITSDYRFHGFSESDRRPAIQGNLHLMMPDNWYAGAYATSIDFRDGSTSYEVDWYGGRHIFFRNNDLNLEALYYTFPNKAGPTPTYDAVQGSAELTHTFNALKLAGKIEVKHAHAGLGYELDASAFYDVTPWLTLSGTTGYQNGEHSFGRMNWEIGATASWRQWQFDVRYAGTNIDRPHCYYTNWCATGLNATVTYQFGWVL